MNLDIPTPSPERLKEDVQHLKDWLSKEPHLPQIEDETWLGTMLFANKFSLEKTKYKLENLFTLRNKLSHVLKNRDPTSPEILQAREAVTYAISDNVMKNNTMIYYLKFNDPSRLNIVDFTKRIFMVTDVVILEHPRLNNFVTIVDCNGIQCQHVLKVTMGGGLMSEVFNKIYSERTRGVHLINAPSTVHIFTDFLKGFFSAKMEQRIYTHTPKQRSVLDYADEDVLSSDFGGRGSSLAELDEYTQKLLEKHRKWFEEQDNVCSNESLRRKDGNQIEELKGSFRKLEVD